MKVSHWTTRVLQTPADNPLVVGVPQPGTREFVTLELDTDEGIQGIGVTFFGGPLTPALRAAVDNLCELTVGQDPMQVEAVAESLKQAAGGAGPEASLPWPCRLLTWPCGTLRARPWARPSAHCWADAGTG